MAVSVTQAATKVVPASTGRHLETVKNTGANPVTLAKTSGLTFGAGFSLAAAGSMQVDLDSGEELYGICGSGLTTTIEVL